MSSINIPSLIQSQQRPWCVSLAVPVFSVTVPLKEIVSLASFVNLIYCWEPVDHHSLEMGLLNIYPELYKWRASRQYNISVFTKTKLQVFLFCSVGWDTIIRYQNFLPLAKFSVDSCLLLNQGNNISQLEMGSKSQKQLTKTATISGGSGKQHKNSATLDSFGYTVRYVNMKFRLLFSVVKLTKTSLLWHQRNENELSAGVTEELCCLKKQ